jgi:hypothetical protein
MNFARSPVPTMAQPGHPDRLMDLKHGWCGSIDLAEEPLIIDS